VGDHHAHRRFKALVVAQLLDVEKQPIRIGSQGRVLVEQL